MTRILPPVLLIAALASAGAGVYYWRAERAEQAPPDGPTFSIRNPDHDAGPVAVGRTVEVLYPITNTGTRPIRVVGAGGGGCGRNCCFAAKYAHEDQPLVIPAGETVGYPCVLKVTGPGPIEWVMNLFLDDGGIRTARITVRGTAVKGATDDAHAP